MRKFILSGVVGVGALVIVFSVNAGAYTIDDNYFGGYEVPITAPSSAVPGVYSNNIDVLGGNAKFEVHGMNVTIGDRVIVDIYSNYFDNIGELGTELGDLFVSDNGWNPSGSSPYGSDVASNGEIWEHALVLDDYSGQTQSGDLFLYSITGRSDSNIEFSRDATGYNSLQEVQYSGTGATVINNNSWAILGSDGNKFLRFDFYNSIGLTYDNNGFRWTMSCANDMIEGRAPVPEPSTLLLFGVGAIGLAGSALRRKKK